MPVNSQRRFAAVADGMHHQARPAGGIAAGEVANIQTQIEQLLVRMNASIAESESFIKTLPK